MSSRSIAVASLGAVALLLCTSCSENNQNGQPQRSQSTGSPDISPAAAPGVAFNYAYEFSLPDGRIAAAQEAHASACENLGLSRCQITGMSYSIDQNEDVTAELDLKLDPAIARQFGKSAEQAIVGDDGKLIRLDIGSSDEGATIDQVSKQKSDTSAQITQLQQELSRTRAGTDAHANLLAQIQLLQRQASQQSQTIAASQSALATTPMEFHYYGRGGVPGFRGNPLREAWQTLVMTVVWIVGILLQALAVLVPVGVLLAMFIALWRSGPMRWLRDWIKGPQEATD